MNTQKKSNLGEQISNELLTYRTRKVTLSKGVEFSTKDLTERISLFESHTYPSGKFDSQDNYKFFFDLFTSRVSAEVKNIDFDTVNIEPYSPRKIDELPLIVVNLKLKQYLRETGQAEEINSAIEEGAGWGNIAWKKVKGGYERCDLRNFFVINQTAQNLDQTPVIERHQFSQTDIRDKSDSWKYVDEVIKDCKSDSYSSTTDVVGTETTVPYYEMYERNGEVNLAELKKEKGETPKAGDENKYVLAKVIGAGTKGNGAGTEIKYIVFAEEIKKMPYKEYHRSRYKGRWFREGLVELLFDCQVRANQIGNQIAQGLEWASKTSFYSGDKLIVQNILSDMKNGDIIKADSIKQIEVRMQGFEQLTADWNRIIALANEISNSQEVVQGITPVSGTPLGTTEMLNVNANKMFDFIREKLAIPFSEIFEEWIIPELIKSLKAEEILRLTGDSDMLDRIYMMIADEWYIQNLMFLPPHSKEDSEAFKDEKIVEMQKNPVLLMRNLKSMWDGFRPHVSIEITGENSIRKGKMQVLAQFIALELDPLRRTALVEKAMKIAGIDTGGLPSTPPAPQQPAQQQPQASVKPPSFRE